MFEGAYFVLGEPIDKEDIGKSFILKIADNIKEYEYMSYTTDLNTLKLIFDNLTIRSTSLAKITLNDPIEKERVGVSRFAASRFITCFSNCNHEIIPFWMYYGGQERSQKVLLQFQNFTTDFESRVYLDYGKVANEKKCFFDSHEYTTTINTNGIPGQLAGYARINEDYDTRACIDRMDIFDVEYVPIESEVFTNDYSGEANIDFNGTLIGVDNSVQMQGYDATVLGKQKSNPWDYEKETRIMVTLNSPTFDDWEYVDLRLKSEFFRNLKIVMSPWAEEYLRENIEQVIRESTLSDEIKNSIQIVESGLKGKLNL